MDDFLAKFDGMDHYALLGVAVDADAPTIQRGWASRSRRYDPAFAPPAERAQFERAVAAIETAYEILSDPIKRHRYDQSRSAKATPVNATLADFTWVATPSASSPVLASSSERTSGDELRAQLAADPRIEALHADFSRSLHELERIGAAVHLLLARSVEPAAVPLERVIEAAQTLTETRATLASMQAQFAERAGNYAQAALLWQRVARQRSRDASPLVRASIALRKAGQDLEGAESLARRAIELDPDSADAQAALAVTQALRARRSADRR